MLITLKTKYELLTATLATSRTGRLTQTVAPWVAFLSMLVWAWRVTDVFNRIPAYGDTLEVIWGIRQYHDALFTGRVSALFTPLVFAPNGWHTATLAHTPLLFLLAQPFNLIGGAAFAYNVLALLPFVVAYAGCLKLLRPLVAPLPATVATLVFTFFAIRWLRINGHLHILWASSFLPWLLSVLVNIGHGDRGEGQTKWSLLAGGLLWGLAVNFSYYSVFLGAIPFAVWGRQLFSIKRLRQAAVITLITISVSAPTLVLNELGNRADQLIPWDVNGLQLWGASLNSLPDVSYAHPIALLRQLSAAIYTGPVNETIVDEFGLVTTLLAVVGSAWVIWRCHPRIGFIWLAGAGFVLSMGLLLRWNSQEVVAPVFTSLDTLLWHLGRALKPGVFTAAEPWPPYNTGIPLPGYLLTAIIPFYESARVMARYAVAGALGLIVLAAIGLQRLPNIGRWLVSAIWVVEVLPAPTGSGVPITTVQPHQAFIWLAQQSLAAGESVIDITSPTLMIGGEVLTELQFTGKPTLSGVGSFMPSYIYYLWTYLIEDSVYRGGQAMGGPVVPKMLAQYGVRYILFHFKTKGTDAMWDLATKNPLLRAVGCFEPNKGPSPWPYRICVAEVLPQRVNVITTTGWSGPEPWGQWAEGLESQADWLATSQTDYTLTLDAFPYCAPHESTTTQTVRITVNGQALAEHDWRTCEVWHGVVTIPGAVVRVGSTNHVVLQYAQASRPADREPGNSDLRALSVGYTQLTVQRK